MNILFQFVHPYPERSRANLAILEAVADIPGITVNDLYAAYPQFYVDIKREQSLLVAADLVVFQHPVYWYSAPALLKEWLDVVLEPGFAYGSRGVALQGKTWLHSITTGMGPDAYTQDGFNAATMTDFLKPFEATARFCGMHWQSPLLFHDARASSEDTLRRHCTEVRNRLLADLLHEF